MINEKRDPATDDARSSDEGDAELRRTRLADDASEGLHHTLSEDLATTTAPSSDKPTRTPASSSLGTSAEGTVEDGEAASAIEVSRSARQR